MRQLESVFDSISRSALWRMQFLFRCFICNSCFGMNEMDCRYNDILIAGFSPECVFSSRTQDSRLLRTLRKETASCEPWGASRDSQDVAPPFGQCLSRAGQPNGKRFFSNAIKLVDAERRRYLTCIIRHAETTWDHPV
jgi:hypothetical protein